MPPCPPPHPHVDASETEDYNNNKEEQQLLSSVNIKKEKDSSSSLPNDKKDSFLELSIESFPLYAWPYAPLLLWLGMIVLANKTFGCPNNAKDNVFLYIYHVSVCGGPGADTFSLREGERIVLYLTALVGVFAYVIPKHLKRDGAKRMYVSNKVTRVLVLHIASGVVVVLGAGLAGIFNGGLSPTNSDGSPSWLFWFLAVVDFLHEMTVLRLLKNHDGIFALRIDNAVAGFAKFQALLNCHRYTPTAIADILFFTSWGFMGTRIVGVLSWIQMKLFKNGDGIILEHTYSLGVSGAIHYIIGRATGYGTQVWLVVAPVVTFFYYHELWNRREKPLILAAVSLGSLVMMRFGGFYSRFFYMMAFHIWTLTRPMYYRLPHLALGGTLETKSQKRASLADPALRSIYRRDSFSSLTENNEQKSCQGESETMVSFSMERATQGPEAMLPQDYRRGLKFGGGRAWAPSKEYRMSFDNNSNNDEKND